MAYLIERNRDAAGNSYPDYDDHPDGILIYENTPRAAIKAYARRVLKRPGTDPVELGEEFELTPVDDEARFRVGVTDRRVSFKLEEHRPS